MTTAAGVAEAQALDPASRVDDGHTLCQADIYRQPDAAHKRASDPRGLLNPGKAVQTLARCAEFGRMHVRHGQLPFPDLPRF